jgi:DNA-binding MarR family transcriptional regulator
VITNRLVAQNLLQRVAHPNDRHSLFLELTDEGHEMMRTIHSDFTTMIAASTTGLTAPQLDAFETALKTVAGEVSARTALAVVGRTA